MDVCENKSKRPYELILVAAEHLIEVKLMALFMQWAVKGDNCAVDCGFFADFFTQEVINGAPRTPGSGQDLKRPIDRVMEQFGSKSNKEVFRLLRQSINVIKGDVSIISFRCKLTMDKY